MLVSNWVDSWWIFCYVTITLNSDLSTLLSIFNKKIARLSISLGLLVSGSRSGTRAQAEGFTDSDHLHVLLTSTNQYIFIDHIEEILIGVFFFLSGFRYPWKLILFKIINSLMVILYFCFNLIKLWDGIAVKMT